MPPVAGSYSGGFGCGEWLKETNWPEQARNEILLFLQNQQKHFSNRFQEAQRKYTLGAFRPASPPLVWAHSTQEESAGNVTPLLSQWLVGDLN